MSPARSGSNFRIAIDTGGTFTDCVWVERGRVRMLKVFSTPADPSEAIAEALRKVGAPGSLIILHGTTVGTNTLLQRKGARVALVTTAGFEDAIEIGRQARPRLYDFFFDRVEPLVPAERRFGVDERTASDGEILHAASRRELAPLLKRLREAHPEAIAISLLFSFANPNNESAVAQACRSLGVPISLSHEILPEFREYERTSTVVVNAYLQPVVQKYLENLARRAHSSRGKSNIFLMQSSGGITALTSAAREPVRTVLSGPAGGVVGAAAMARHSGFERIISFDMGGTSTDVALVDREIRTGSQAEIAGFPVGVPMLDIHTVGAGGGSIARFDAAGALRVGPESAGADPRDFTLVAFGGAGGLHACELAEALGIPRVIVPALPGALSAFGILVSDVVKDYSRTVLWRIAGKLPAELFEREFAILRRNAEKSFREEGWRGAINFRRSVDVRYRGQGYELNVPYSNTLAEDFRREHQRRYGYSYDRELELVTLRLRAKIRTSQAKISPG